MFLWYQDPRVLERITIYDPRAKKQKLWFRALVPETKIVIWHPHAKIWMRLSCHRKNTNLWLSCHKAKIVIWSPHAQILMRPSFLGESTNLWPLCQKPKLWSGSLMPRYQWRPRALERTPIYGPRAKENLRGPRALNRPLFMAFGNTSHAPIAAWSFNSSHTLSTNLILKPSRHRGSMGMDIHRGIDIYWYRGIWWIHHALEVIIKVSTKMQRTCRGTSFEYKERKKQATVGVHIKGETMKHP